MCLVFYLAWTLRLFDTIGLRLSNTSRAVTVAIHILTIFILSLSSANATNYLTTSKDDVRHSINSLFAHEARKFRVSIYTTYACA